MVCHAHIPYYHSLHQRGYLAFTTVAAANVAVTGAISNRVSNYKPMLFANMEHLSVLGLKGLEEGRIGHC